MPRFEFTELKDGFDIKFRDTDTVIPIRYDTKFHCLTVTNNRNKYSKSATNLFAYRQLCSDITRNLVLDFDFSKYPKLMKGKWDKQKWLSNQIGKYIGKLIHTNWKNL